MKFRVFSVLCFALSGQFLPRAAMAAEAVPTPAVQAINDVLQAAVDDKQCAGAVTLVAHQGQIRHLGAVGHANVEQNQAMTPDTMFSIASMTKPIVATGLMILHDEGKLDVDDKVSKYIPAFADVKLKNGDKPSREITIRDAITHTSGLNGSQLFPGTLAEGIEELVKRPLAFEPGTKWQYSPGLNVAGRIIEIVSKQPLEEYLQQRIFQPLQMNDTAFRLDEKQLRRLAAVYAPGDKQGTIKAVPNFISRFADVKGANPSGGLASTAHDLQRFYQMVLNGGELEGKRILSKEAVKQMTSQQTGDLQTGFTPGNCWGLGWCVVREPQGVSGMLSKGTFGHGGAFGTQGWVDPQTQTIYVLLIQRTKFGNADGASLRGDFQKAANQALGI